MPGSDPKLQYQPPVEIATKLTQRIKDKKTRISKRQQTYIGNQKCAIYETLFGDLRSDLQKFNQPHSPEQQLPIPTRTEFFNYLQTQKIFEAPVNSTDLATAIIAYEQTEPAARPLANASSQSTSEFVSFHQLLSSTPSPCNGNGQQHSTPTNQTPGIVVSSSAKTSDVTDLKKAIIQLQQVTTEQLKNINSNIVELKPLREDKFMDNLQTHFDKLAAQDSKKIPTYVKLVEATTNLIGTQPANDVMECFQRLLGEFKKDHKHSTGRNIVMGLAVLTIGILSFGMMIPKLLKSTWYTGEAKQISVKLFMLSNSSLHGKSDPSASPPDTMESQSPQDGHRSNCPV